MAQNSDVNVSVLLVVWGKKYISDFLQFSLPSLLAPNNIPLLTANYKTRFVFLARQEDVETFEADSYFQTLKSICDVQFVFIDDLIVFGHYATTITLAYERVIKQAGKEMLNTYFVLLTSDLIMADGSIKGLIRHIKDGYSAVYVGSLQLLREKIEPYLLDKVKNNAGPLTIPPRELLKESLKHLHPIVFANLYTQNLVHNYRAHRFFLRQDQQFLAGRYYLLHPLCIKPETVDFNIGSSFDYSFVPAMCPSGNTVILKDSDDFLIVEIQEKEHELELIASGQYSIKKLARGLAEWTTALHRDNATQSIYFHTRDLTEEDKAVAEEKLNLFVSSLQTELQKYKPKPSTGHLYWANTITAYNKQRTILQTTKAYEYPDLSVLNDLNLAKKIYYACLGVPPKVRRCHYRWNEYQSVMKTLRSCISDTDKNNVAVFYWNPQLDFMWYRSWLEKTFKITQHYHLKNLCADQDQLQVLSQKKFEKIILLANLEDLEAVSSSLNSIRTMIANDGECSILAFNGKNNYSFLLQNFWGNFAHNINAVMNTNYSIVSLKTNYSNTTMLGAITIERINKTFAYSRKLRFLSYVLLGSLGSLYCLIRNLWPFAAKSGHCTYACISLKPESTLSEEHG